MFARGVGSVCSLAVSDRCVRSRSRIGVFARGVGGGPGSGNVLIFDSNHEVE